jgi:hypothetical protein
MAKKSSTQTTKPIEKQLWKAVDKLRKNIVPGRTTRSIT